MPTECAHATCGNVVGVREGISFHRFPSDPKRRARWAWLMRRRDGWSPKVHDRVCSDHFTEADFDRTGQTIRLRNGVEPSVFDLPDHLQKVSKPRQTRNSNRKRPAPAPSSQDTGISFGEELPPQSQCSTPNFHSYAGKDEACFKEKWLRAESRAMELERKLQIAIKREKRFKRSLSTLQSELRENNLLSEQLQQKLDAFGDFPIDLFKSASSSAYTDEQKRFALTLHLYGPKAYGFLRKKMNLPSTITLRRWLSKTDGSPGLDLSTIEALQEKVEKEPSTYSNVAETSEGETHSNGTEARSRQSEIMDFEDEDTVPDPMFSSPQDKVVTDLGSSTC